MDEADGVRIPLQQETRTPLIESLPYQPIYHTIAIDGQFIQEEEIQQEVHESFLQADRYVFRIGGALGDSVLETGYINGLLAAIQKIRRKNLPITLLVDQGKYELFEEYSDKKGIEVVPMQVDPEDPIASMHDYVKAQEGKVFAIDFYQSPDPNIMPGGDPHDPSPHFYRIKSESGNNVRLIGNAFHADMLEHYANIWPADKFGVYIQRLLGIPHTLQPEEAQPRLFLPSDARKRYRELTSKLNIDRNAIQIGCIFQTTHPTKIYSLENWKEVLTQMTEGIRQHYKGRSVNFNIMVGPTESDTLTALVGEDRLHEVFEGLQAEGVQVNFIKVGLGDLKILLSRQDLVIADDAGPSHIAAQVDGGPPVVSVYLPYGLTQKTWATGARHFGVGLNESEMAALDKKRFDMEFVLEGNKTINIIPPKRISEAAMNYLSQQLEEQQSPLGRARKILQGN